jgi:hypothetical protein
MENKSHSETSILKETKNLFDLFLEQVGDLFKLATVELRLAMASIITIMIAAIVSALIVVTLWIGMQAMSIMLLEQVGFSLLRSIMLLFFINLLLLSLIIRVIRENLKLVGFETSIKQITSSKSSLLDETGYYR